MIRFFLLQNKGGKTRLSKYYQPCSDEEKIKIEHDVHKLCLQRDTSYASFVEYKNFKLVYRRYAGLYFVFAIDVVDNELLYLESIHLFVEVRHLWTHMMCRYLMDF